MYCTRENFGGGSFGELYRCRLLVRKTLANKLQSVHMPNTFSVLPVNIGEDHFGE